MKAVGVFAVGALLVLVWATSGIWEGLLAKRAVLAARNGGEERLAFQQADAANWEMIEMESRTGGLVDRSKEGWEGDVRSLRITWAGGVSAYLPLRDPENLRAFHDCANGKHGKYGVVWLALGLAGAAAMIGVGLVTATWEGEAGVLRWRLSVGRGSGWCGGGRAGGGRG
jgi:hypothetical protein